jgi:cytochrome c biogenesis protein CcdA/thiol-disulfide isomerase/thioredoxin
MQTDLLNVALGFLEGFALIISPCILPILPLILSSSLTGSKKRPIGIIVGFILTFALFTFFARSVVQYTGIDLGLIRLISYSLLLLLGSIMLSTYLTEKFNLYLQCLMKTGATFNRVNDPEGGLLSGIFFGGLIGIIWTPCAGPILAAVIVQTVIQQTTLTSFLIVLAFGMGAAIPMLGIALFGRKIMNQFSFFKSHSLGLRKIVGGIIIAVVAYMIVGENNAAPLSTPINHTQNGLIEGLSSPYPAPAIAGISTWINSPPLQLKQLKGKVVLIDFWTYSCINCVRTLPYLNDWYRKYHQAGLEIIGVHTPEFEFEKALDNVKKAVLKDQIHYPVALDSQFVTWQNFQNSYWPAHYLIDKNGKVVYQHFGEGGYDVTENNIRYLLGVKAMAMPNKLDKQELDQAMTPETYLGYARAAHFMSPENVKRNQAARYTFPIELTENQWALQGDWRVAADKVTATAKGAAVKIHFKAGKVFVVMGNAAGIPIKVKLLLNGEVITHEKGKDVVNSVIQVNGHALYQALELQSSTSGILQLLAASPGLEVYTFTFGT